MTKVLEGRKGFLFLDNDANNVQLQTTGIPFMTEDRFAAIALSHQNAAKRSKARAGRYIHIIAPNKETACRDYLPCPEAYESLGKTPANLFLANADWSASTYFNHNVLCDHTRQYNHYDVEESHWSTSGALTYLDLALSHFGWMEELARLRNVSIDITVRKSLADLARLADLPPRMLPRLSVKYPGSAMLFKGKVKNEGHVEHYINSRGRGRALILHDSFIVAILPFLVELFAETLTAHCPDFLVDLEDGYRPDVVIKLQAERFFPYIPVERSSTHEWLTEVEMRKQFDCSDSRAYLGAIISPALRVAAE